LTDPYSRLDYRRLIAWPPRIEREWPFIREVLQGAPSKRVLDLGCGTGEHARFLVSKGFEVIGVDRSTSNLSAAREEPLPHGLELIEGDLRDLATLVTGDFGGAVCLGNTLPHITDGESLGAFLAGARRRLLPGAPILIQCLNYDRIFTRQERSLPINFRHDDEGEIVFLRLMDLRDDGTVGFFPSTLLFEPEADPPLTVKATKRVELCGWRSVELGTALRTAGFDAIEMFGAYDGSPFSAEDSRDLIVIAR